MTVPDEAVEAAAGKVLETLDRGFTAYQIAYAALDAAAPFIAAQAWDECNATDTPWVNPYRSEQ